MSDDIPIDLLRQHILVRVPAQALLRFRSVCKTWRDIIDEPVFANLEHRIPGGSGPDRLVIVPEKTDNFLPLYSLSSIFSPDDSITHSQTFYCETLPMPTCNGIILLAEISVLWNPFTGETLRLLPPPHVDPHAGPYDNICVCSGIGYDSSTDDYKVAHILNFKPLGTCIYSLKLNSWKRIGDFTFADCSPECSCENLWVFVNGALYWSFCNSECEGIIVALDVCSEKYRLLELPSAATEKYYCPPYHLGVLADEYLCVSWFTWDSKYLYHVQWRN